MFHNFETKISNKKIKAFFEMLECELITLKLQFGSTDIENKKQHFLKRYFLLS